MHASFINVNYFTNAAFLTVTRRLGAFYVGQAITIVALATILLYSYFVSNFFNTSLILFKESDEYKRTCKKYEDPNVLVTVRPRIAKTLRNMHFITKIQLIEYYENRKLLRKNPQIDKVIEYSNEKANDAGAKIDLVSTNKETIEQSIVLDDDNVADKKN
jgi:hypothetical protein